MRIGEQRNENHLSEMILLNLYTNQSYCMQMKITAAENYTGPYIEDLHDCNLW